MCGEVCLLKFYFVLFLIGSHGPLLPLPSRYRMGSRDTPELVAYPLPQASSSYMHGGNPSGSVVMVSGLHQLKMNCSRVFNLFCLYGNIEKVSFIFLRNYFLKFHFILTSFARIYNRKIWKGCRYICLLVFKSMQVLSVVIHIS